MKISAVFLVVVCLLAVPLSAQSSAVTIWATKQLNDESSHFTDDPALTAQLGDGEGFGVSFSRRFGHHLSGELSVFRMSSDGEIRRSGSTIADLGGVDFMPLMAMVRFHLRPDGPFDIYAGAGVAHTIIDDLSSQDIRDSGLEEIKTSNETTAVVGAGATFDFSRRWGLAADVRYLPIEINGRPVADPDNVSADLNPLLFSVGLRVRF
jgi:outer membrane protein W